MTTDAKDVSELIDDVYEAVSEVESACHPLNGGHRYERAHNDLSAALKAVSDHIATLTQQRDDARRGVERLDWLAQGRKEVAWRFRDGTGSLSENPKFEFAIHPFSRDRIWTRYDLQWFHDVREAIDTARANGNVQNL